MTIVLTRVVPVVEPTQREWALLDPTEGERAVRRADPAPFVTAHGALRRLLGDHLGCRPEGVVLDRACPSCGSTRHGRPVLRDHPDVHVSLSYTEEMVVAAVTEGGRVGVDIEDSRATDFAGFDRVTLADVERAALVELTGAGLLRARATVWARKEAVLKATGHGLVIDPTTVIVSPASELARLTGWAAEQPEPDPVAMADLRLDDGIHAGAVAVLAAGPLVVRQA